MRQTRWRESYGASQTILEAQSSLLSEWKHVARQIVQCWHRLRLGSSNRWQICERSSLRHLAQASMSLTRTQLKVGLRDLIARHRQDQFRKALFNASMTIVPSKWVPGISRSRLNNYLKFAWRWLIGEKGLCKRTLPNFWINKRRKESGTRKPKSYLTRFTSLSHTIRRLSIGESPAWT